MNSVTQNTETRPSEPAEPPASERKKKAKKPPHGESLISSGSKARETDSIGGLLESMPNLQAAISARGSTCGHEERIAARVAQEARERTAFLLAFRETTNEINGGDLRRPCAQYPTSALFASAAGFQRDADPVLMLVEEAGDRAETLMLLARNAVHAGEDMETVFESLDRELDRLNQRLHVAAELIRRLDLPRLIEAELADEIQAAGE